MAGANCCCTPAEPCNDCPPDEPGECECNCVDIVVENVEVEEGCDWGATIELTLSRGVNCLGAYNCWGRYGLPGATITCQVSTLDGADNRARWWLVIYDSLTPTGCELIYVRNVQPPCDENICPRSGSWAGPYMFYGGTLTAHGSITSDPAQVTFRACSELPESECPDCPCHFEDAITLSIPGLELEIATEDGLHPATLTIPAIDFELLRDCPEASGLYNDSPPGLSLVWDGPHDPVSDLRIEIFALLTCVECYCVAYWCLTITMNLYGDIGDGEILLWESAGLSAMRPIPPIDPLIPPGGCDPAQTNQGDYDILACAVSSCCDLVSAGGECAETAYTVSITA